MSHGKSEPPDDEDRGRRDAYSSRSIEANGRAWGGSLQSELVMPGSPARRSVAFEGIAATGHSKTAAQRDGASQRGIGSILAKPCQARPSFCFKVTMSGSNALRLLTLF